MQDAMTKMSEKEVSFEKEQGTLQSYEKKEQKLYTKMIQTTKDHTKTVSSLSDQALASAAKREEHLKTEKDITKYEYEPWHLRYVGKEAAKAMHDHDLTFEEYMNKVKKI
ncbi:YkyA family protein [Bacillus safensis]|uniref:YkyA family protein n=1 Tax=Bacillus safensis TaxID=561879 RepID=UPI00227DB28F